MQFLAFDRVRLWLTLLVSSEEIEPMYACAVPDLLIVSRKSFEGTLSR